MKTAVRVFVVLLFLGNNTRAQANNQVADAGGLKQIILQSERDSILQIERLAALYFHEMLNAYRKDSGQLALGWSDTLWLASRNHTIWMLDNNELSHSEKPNTKSFTGKDPGDRETYVTKRMSYWSGENCLYNYSGNGKTIQEKAKHIALYSINQWKKSPGHNRNMLRNHAIHGVAFVIKNGVVWATDLFARHGTGKIVVADVPKDDAPVRVEPQQEKPQSKKKVNVNTRTAKLDIAQALYTADRDVKRKKSLEKAASAHALYMASVNKLTHEQQKGKRAYYGETLKQRVNKASAGGTLLKGEERFGEIAAIVEVDVRDYSVEAVVKTIQTQLEKDRAKQGLNDKSAEQVGFGVEVKRKKNVLMIYVVSVERY
jgi:uncharacterized protein YkwD